MRKLYQLVLSIVVALSLSLPAMAEELKCTTDSTPPSAEFIELVGKQYPELTDTQATTIAKGLQAALQTGVAIESATTDEGRQLAQREEQLVLKIIALQLKTFESLPRMEAVLQRMEVEQKAGLKKVSAELEPEVRATSREMIGISRIWGKIASEANVIAVDRAMVAARNKSNSNTIKFIEQTGNSLCVIKASMNVMKGVADILPGAILLANAEHLNY